MEVTRILFSVVLSWVERLPGVVVYGFTGGFERDVGREIGYLRGNNTRYSPRHSRDMGDLHAGSTCTSMSV